MSSHIPQIQVAMGDDFLASFSALNQKALKKTREFIEKFRSDPTSPGLNYECIHMANDPNLRSVRVDQDYRAIVLKPEAGNSYILLWVDKHDDAYAWAKKRKCAIHPMTGAIQIMAVQEVEPTAQEQQTTPIPVVTTRNVLGLFDPYTQKELLGIGVPESFINEVRAVTSDRELEALKPRLPSDAFEALYFLAIGGSIEETKRELGIEQPAQVDTTDFATALERQSGKRNFAVITDHAEMEKVLAYPLDRWRTFLHPSQRRMVEMQANGPVRVLGGAGTGKTVVAIHRAKYLAENICTAQEKVLITTFTRNLAADIEANLKKLCSLETLHRIEVKNLDAWANQLLTGRSGKRVRVDFKGHESRKLWQDALSFASADCPLSEPALRDEWDYVVQAQGIRDESSYIRASRIGMGKPLSRAARKTVWPVFAEYISLLKEAGICEVIDVLRMAREFITNQKLVLDYRAVIVDEAQDFSAEAFRLVNAIVPEIRKQEGNHLFIVGDAHQRLYGHKVVLSHCGIDIRGRGRRLLINYRTSEETRNWATAILQDCPIDDLDGGLDTTKGYRSLFHGEDPVVDPASGYEEQIEKICAHLKLLTEHATPLQSVCLVAKTNALVTDLVTALTNKAIDCHTITASEGDDSQLPGLRCATMHRVKGIEFDHMILAHLERNLWTAPDGSIPVENRSLLYVAATRARKSVFVTSAGEAIALVCG
jgi:hypothetical protein